MHRDDLLRVTHFAPVHRKCGVRVYSEHLLQALRQLPDLAEPRVVAAPEWSQLTESFGRRRLRYRQLGASLAESSDLAHIQHQYFLFGGVAPHRTVVRSLLDAVRVPAVMTVHEIVTPEGNPLRRMAIKLANRMNFRHTALRRLIVHTGEDRDRLVASGIGQERVRVVRHGIPAAPPLPDPADVRARWEQRHPALRGRRTVVLFGFLAVKKGHHVALRAMAQLPADIALIFAGDRHPDDHTPYVASLREQITRLALNDRTIITGYLDDADLPELMALSEVAIAPFLQTSGSGSLSLLLSFGRPVVASNIAPHREIAAEAPNMLALFASQDAAAMAEAVERLLRDARLRAEMGSSALQYAKARSYLRMAEETVAVYREALG